MSKKILTPQQENVLKFIAKSNLKDLLYFTGGTALSACYLQHRFSTDIDLFSMDLIDNISLQIFVQEIKKNLQIKNIEHISKLNRNLYNLDGLKFEIVYFPFPLLTEQKEFLGVKTDSFEDLATNKLLALYQRNDPKDIFDLYFILQKGHFTTEQLLQNVEKKFGEVLNHEFLLGKIQKNLSLLNLLEPLAFDKKIIPKIQNYFQKSNQKYLISILI